MKNAWLWSLGIVLGTGACNVGTKSTEIVRNESRFGVTSIQLRAPCFFSTCQTDDECKEEVGSASTCDMDNGFCTSECPGEFGPNIISTTLPALGCSDGCGCDPDCDGVEPMDGKFADGTGRFDLCECDASQTKIDPVDCAVYEVLVTEEGGATCNFDVPDGLGNLLVCFANQRWLIGDSELGDCADFPPPPEE